MKPLLAYTIEDTSKLQYPIIASPKLDGIRVLIIDGVVMSRKLKPIRNHYVQSLFGRPALNGLDGELIVGPPNASNVYNATYSGVMSEDGEPDVTLHLFDRFDRPSEPFDVRFAAIPHNVPHTVIVPHHYVVCEKTLLELEEKLLSYGYEGLMIRKIKGTYKFGRSTDKEGILGKLKRFQDDEFKVVGFQERMHNANEATKDELGNTKRSSHKENLIGRGDLGALELIMSNGARFTCGTGFDDALRKEIWNNQPKYLGRMAVIKHFAYGAKDVVRFPVFKGFRDPDDMGEPA